MNFKRNKSKEFALLSLGKNVGRATGDTFYRAKNFTRKSGILFTILFVSFIAIAFMIMLLGFKFILILIDIS